MLWVDYRGRRALKLAPREGHERDTDQIGISFRLRGDSAERFYIRPEHSRGNSQLYRNRSTQYESEPDSPWQRLRQEAPGVYESYVDVISGAWTKLGRCRGRIALWTRVSSEAYFANLRVTPR